MKTLTSDEMPRLTPETLELENGMTLRVDCEYDVDHEAPWEDGEGRGEVSEWTTRDKRSGERLLHSDRGNKRYYDFASTLKIAKRDGWDAEPYHAAFPGETRGQQAARAVEADFKFCRDWCEDRWHYIGVIVILQDAEGLELGCDSLWGVESCGDYWREIATEMANAILASYIAESEERAHWEARDTITVGGVA